MKNKIISLALVLLLLVSILAGCSSSSSGATSVASSSSSSESPTSLRLILYGDMTSRREAFFKGEFHDAVLEDLNIDLSVEFMPWGSDVNVATMLASGEAFAVMNIISMYDWASKGYLAEIDQALIDETMPNFLNMRGENNGFECVKYDDKIYAIPFGAKSYAGSLQYFDLREDILTELGYKAEDINTLEKLEEVFAAVQANYPSMRVIMNEDFLRAALHYYCTDGKEVSADHGMTFTYINELDDSDTVYSYYESEAFKNLCTITKRWADAGYIQKDEITNPTQADADWQAGNCFSRNGMPGALISTSLQAVTPQAIECLVKIGDFPSIKQADYDWGISISKSDEANVGKWLQLFDWMYQDQDHFNFCVYGVEGVDWEPTGDGSIKKLVTDNFIESWFMEAIPYNVYNSSISQEKIEQYENFDNGSIMSKKAGFAFDTTPVAAEYAMLTSVYDEKIWPLYLGFAEYDVVIDDIIASLKNAGLDTYVAEYQRQFSEFCAKQ